MELISREALLKSIKGIEVAWYMDGNYETYDDTTIMEIIKEQPTVEAREVIHAEWIEGRVDGRVCINCSNCGSIIPTDTQVDYLNLEDNRYCYWCGAIMDK